MLDPLPVLWHLVSERGWFLCSSCWGLICDGEKPSVFLLRPSAALQPPVLQHVDYQSKRKHQLLLLRGSCTARWYFSTAVDALFSWFLPGLRRGFCGVQQLPPSMWPHWTWSDEAESVCGCEPHHCVLWSRSPTVLTWLPMFFCLVVTLTLSCHLFIPPYLSQFWMFVLTRPFLDSDQKDIQMLNKNEFNCCWQCFSPHFHRSLTGEKPGDGREDLLLHPALCWFCSLSPNFGWVSSSDVGQLLLVNEAVKELTTFSCGCCRSCPSAAAAEAPWTDSDVKDPPSPPDVAHHCCSYQKWFSHCRF